MQRNSIGQFAVADDSGERKLGLIIHRRTLGVVSERPVGDILSSFRGL